MGGGGLPWWLSGKESACQCRRHKRDMCLTHGLGKTDPLEKAMTTHSSTLAWTIEKPGGLQSIGVPKESDTLSD